MNTVWCLFDEDDLLLRVFASRESAIETARIHLENYTDNYPWVGDENENSVDIYAKWYTSATETVKWQIIKFEVED